LLAGALAAIVDLTAFGGRKTHRVETRLFQNPAGDWFRLQCKVVELDIEKVDCGNYRCMSNGQESVVLVVFYIYIYAQVPAALTIVNSTDLHLQRVKHNGLESSTSHCRTFS